MNLEIKTIEQIQYFEYKDKQKEKWVKLENLNRRLSSIMNVRNDEKMMRLLIIDLQLELKGE